MIVQERTIGRCRIILGDSAEVLPHLPTHDLLLTDPPFGIKQDKGMGKGGFGLTGRRSTHVRVYAGGWDGARPSEELFKLMLVKADRHIIWGGNYFSDYLPVSQKWLWWDKLQTMPSYSDGELAWTSLDGTSTKKFVYNGSGLHAKEKDRQHPTQKPIELMRWCLGFVPDAATVIDPFLGSGSSLVACVKMGIGGTGIEINPGYFEVACRRIQEAYDSPDMFVEAARVPEPTQEAML